MPRLISWLGRTKDFDGSTFKAGGPTGELWAAVLGEYDQHVLLLQLDDGEPDLNRAAAIKRYLLDKPYAGRVELRNVAIAGPTDFRSIRETVEPIVVDLEKLGEVHAFISTGTSTMQSVWYFLAQASSGALRIFQTSRAEHRPKGLADLREFVDLSGSRLTHTILQHDHRATPTYDDDGILRDTASLRPVYERAKAVANTDKVFVHLHGESGAGKEDVARYVHKESRRANRPFVAINCAAMGDQLLESRLFGYDKGVFTGADKAREGIFEQAHLGTIFLDEVGDISPFMQQSLLRVLQEGTIQRIGEVRERRVDVRVITASHRDLAQRCTEGHFRWDLYYRLAVVELRIPSFAERTLVERQQFLDHQLRTAAHRFGRARLRLSASAKTFLEAYPFPGNLREVANVIDNLYVFCEGEVGVEDLPVRLRQNETASWNLDEAKRAHVARAIAAFGANKSRVAEVLGVARGTLDKML